MKSIMKKIVLVQLCVSRVLFGIIIPPVAPLMHGSIGTAKLVTIQPESTISPTIEPKITPEAPVAPKIITPAKAVAKVMPKVAANVVAKAVPKVVAKVAPKVMPKIVPVPAKIATTVPKVIAPVKVLPLTPPAPVKTVEKSNQPQHSQLFIRRVLIQNTSKYPATLNGWTIQYANAANQTKTIQHTLATAHVLKPKTKKNDTVIAKIKEIPVSLPFGSSLQGIITLKINGADVPITYKKVAWMPGQLTDVVYVTSANGSTWQLDKKSMDRDYAKLSGNIVSVDSGVQNTNPISKTAQAVAVATMQKKKNKKIKKQSKATQAAATIS